MRHHPGRPGRLDAEDRVEALRLRSDPAFLGSTTPTIADGFGRLQGLAVMRWKALPLYEGYSPKEISLPVAR